MKVVKIILFGLASMNLSSAGNATPLEYDCDTPANNFSEIKVPIQTKGFKIKGKISPTKFSRGTFLPVGNVRITGDDKKSSVAIRTIAQSNNAKHADIFVALDISGDTRQGIIDKVKLAESFDFSIQVLSPDSVLTTINNQAIKNELNLVDSAVLSITCSTGEFKFTDIEWGNE